MGRWAKVLGTGALLSRASHRLQVGPGNAGLGPLKPQFYYGMGAIVSKGWILCNPQLVAYNGTIGYFPSRKLTVVVFSTLGRRSELPVQYGSETVLRIARILTPGSVSLLQARPRG